MQLLAGFRSSAFAGLGGQKKPVGVAFEPWCDAQLSVAIAASHVDVVDLVLQQHLERLVGNILRNAAQRRGSKDDAGAHVASSAERQERDRHASSMPRRAPRRATQPIISRSRRALSMAGARPFSRVSLLKEL